MRKILTSVLAVSIFLSANLFAAEASANTGYTMNVVDNSVLNVNYDVQTDKTLKVMVEKDSKKYIYTLDKTSKSEAFPLQLGTGSYAVTVLENTTGNSYKVVTKNTVSVTAANEKKVYTSSVQNVKWDSSMAAIQKAKELTKNATTDEAKIKAIYDFIVNTYKYDFNKAANVQKDYIPNINEIYSSKQGICYDYSALFASMLRSVNVPTKLVMGNTTVVKEYHAWNEVLINNKWVTIDTTYDAGLKANGKKFTMYKTSADYTAVNVY